MMRYLLFDYETYSEADIKEVGAYDYARHPSTRVLCTGYVEGTLPELEKAPPLYVVPGTDKQGTEHLRKKLEDPNTMLVAHNAFFEQVISHFVLKVPIKPDQWICTAAISRAHGLPGSLDHVTTALNLPHKKDKVGKALMLKLSQPSLKPHPPEDYERLYEYCGHDVIAQLGLFLRLENLHPFERRVWLQNLRMNWRGIAIDRTLVRGAILSRERTLIENEKRFAELTGGLTPGQVAKILDLLAEHDIFPGSLGAEVIEDLLSGPLLPKIREILEIRLTAGQRSSTAKLLRLESFSRSGRLYDSTLYHKAHTGREAGQGAQPHNLYKSTLKPDDLEAGIDLLRAAAVDEVHALYEKPMELYASIMRGCIGGGR